jgi:hypothetical protein
MIKSSKIYKKIAKTIDEYKELVDIEVFTSPTYSEYGDFISQTTSEYTSIPALFSKYDEYNQPEKEGIFQPGDVTIFFKGDQVGLELNNVVIRSNGERWKITKKNQYLLNARNMAKEVSVVKEN